MFVQISRLFDRHVIIFYFIYLYGSFLVRDVCRIHLGTRDPERWARSVCVRRTAYNMQSTTRLQVLFINNKNDEGGMYTRGSHIGDSRPRVHINMTFFRLFPRQRISDKKRPNLYAPVSEMFMGACTKPKCVYSVSFHCFIIIIIFKSLPRSNSLCLSPALFFPVYLFPSILHKSSSMRVTGE